MIISVDPAQPEPPYQQVRVQVLALLANGALTVGTRLPTIRQLAADLDLAAGTVARAYRELEGDGVIETRGRRGTFVRAANPTSTTNEPDRHLDAEAAQLVASARRRGHQAATIAQAIARALADPQVADRLRLNPDNQPK